MDARGGAGPSPWWRRGVLYQAYPRSFADSNGDGIGDLAGIVSRLGYLEWLGVDGLWLNPTMPSPNADWGYDVADYCDVHPDLGTLGDLDRLVGEAGARGIRLLLDLVPAHTSDRHPWFLESRSARDAPRRTWYVWADPQAGGLPPNDWESTFGGPAWTLDERTGQYYLHHFLAEQPDLNWRTEAVREAFDRILRFWFDRGIAGFRIDVAHQIVKDLELRLDVAATHDVLRGWRRLADAHEPRRILLGETYVLSVEDLAAFYGTGEDELDLALNFPFLLAPFEAGALQELVETTERLIPSAAWPVWALSNHDHVRFPTRWCDGDEGRVRCALLALLTLRGTPILYYGDELGMEETAVPPARVRDAAGRDGARTPMPWSGERGAGFTAPDAEPWLPFGDHERRNVEAQRSDPDSPLRLCRDLITLRGEFVDAPYEPVVAPPGVWVWRRGERVLVALNMSDAEAAVTGVHGAVRIATDRARDGERVDGHLELGPWEGAVVAR
ncbi:MAG TPA: alpha-amylase family glycosyl hydrolase [Gaiellaceae bacterium]|nr:alpha-amylase family glycosyl hydrolase [Gaiellaceae bacterium]